MAVTCGLAGLTVVHYGECDGDEKAKLFFVDADSVQIVMEYCGAGSVSDIMKLRRKTVTEIVF